MKTGTTYFFKITLHVKKTVFFSSLLERFFFLSKNMTSNRMFLSRFLFSPTTSPKTASFLSTLCFFFQYRCKITINGFGSTCHKSHFPPAAKQSIDFSWPIRLKTIFSGAFWALSGGCRLHAIEYRYQLISVDIN